MLKAVRNYFGEIREAEKLQRRSMKKWEAEGTKEEAIKVLKLQKRKQRNNLIAGLTSAAVYTGIMAYAVQQQKKLFSTDEEFYNKESMDDVILESRIEAVEAAEE